MAQRRFVGGRGLGLAPGLKIEPGTLEPFVRVIDQRRLPHELVILDIRTLDEAIFAIQDMVVRGAPLIGVTAACAVWLIVRNAPAGHDFAAFFTRECTRLKAARPTAVNLKWAVDAVMPLVLAADTPEARERAAREAARDISEMEVENCRLIGQHGLPLIRDIWNRKGGETVHLLTHCNAGWLACVEWGTATAPLYAPHQAGIPIHAWVDETRSLNQGARLTAWDLGRAGIAHTVITDNAGGHLMQHGRVDLVITGTDRTTRTGDVANKIGTYLKALAARDNGIPFYVALPSTTFDWTLKDGVAEIPIEERDPDEVRFVQGALDRTLERVRITPADSPTANFAFDVTPARLVTGFITERGICRATEGDILSLFPERQPVESRPA